LKNGVCGLSSLGVDGWVEEEDKSRAVLPLTRIQCSIHCETSRLAKRKQAEVGASAQS